VPGWELAFQASKNLDEFRPLPGQHSGEDARVPAVETTALLATATVGFCQPTVSGSYASDGASQRSTSGSGMSLRAW